MILLAIALRISAMVAYWPALMYTDSWAYVNIAFKHFPVGIEAEEPSGYPLLIRILTAPFRNLGVVVLFQHVAGIALGILVYSLLIRLGTWRWLAVAAAAVVLFDGYLVTMEQYIATEAFFTLVVFASFYLVVLWPGSMRVVATSGVLLGLACTIRTVGVFAVPVWILYVVFMRRDPKVVLRAVAFALLPLLLYTGLHAAVGKGFRLVADEGWLLYGRIGVISDCRGVDVPRATRALCDRRGVDTSAARYSGAPGTYPDWYVWDGASPARRLFPSGMTPKSNGELRSFALAVIEAKPGSYANLVARDFVGFFDPTYVGPSLELKIPDEHGNGSHYSTPFTERVRREFVPGYRLKIRTPADFISSYVRWIHTQRWLLAICALLVLSALLTSFIPRMRNLFPQRSSMLLLGGAALAMLLATVIGNGFELRFVIPQVPLLIASGVLGLEAIRRLINSRLKLGTSPQGNSSDGEVPGEA